MRGTTLRTSFAASAATATISSIRYGDGRTLHLLGLHRQPAVVFVGNDLAAFAAWIGDVVLPQWEAHLRLIDSGERPSERT